MKKPLAAFSPAWLLKSFSLRRVLLDLTGGVIVGLMEMFFAISFASLIFTGPLQAQLPLGIGLALFTTMISLAVLPFLTSQPGAMFVVQDVPTVQMAVIAASLALSVSPQALLPTVLVTITLASLLSGLLMVSLGQLKLGKVIRYFPYPVVGGFLAATGWLLVTGALYTLTGVNLSLATLSRFLEPGMLVIWLPALVAGGLMWLATSRVRHPVALPAVIAALLILFYGTLAVLGKSIAQVTQIGLFFQVSSQVAWKPLSPVLLSQVDWAAILPFSGNLLVLMGMTLVGLLLNVSAIELMNDREADLNRDLRVSGLGMILSSLGGGLIGYQALGTTVINQRISGGRRVAGPVAAAVILGAMLSGASVLIYVPKFLMGGVLMYIGLGFLYDWLLAGRVRFSRGEYALVLLITLVIVLTNFLTGVTLGILAAVVLFAFSYSRTRAILRSYDSSEVHSMLSRSPAANDLLREYGCQAYILELQGFLFFGTAITLVDDVKARLAAPAAQPLKYLLIDFRQVTGIDSSAALSFRKILQLAKDQAVTLALADISAEIQNRLQLDGSARQGPPVQVFLNLEWGLEWLENQILSQHLPPAAAQPCTLPEALSCIPAEYYVKINVVPGEVIIQKGAPADSLFFILQGAVSVYLEPVQNSRGRVSAFGPGSVLGEVGLYLNMPRTAYVIADEPACLLKFTRAAMERMSEQEPAAALAFRDFIIRQMADRIIQGDQSIEALRR